MMIRAALILQLKTHCLELANFDKMNQTTVDNFAVAKTPFLHGELQSECQVLLEQQVAKPVLPRVLATVSNKIMANLPNIPIVTTPMLPLGTFVIVFVLVVLIGFSFSMIGSGVSGLIVEVDVDRPRGFLRGPRWVSLNSTGKSAKSWKGC